ncbi:MAG: DUF1844 domain-containing protein [Candidatus Riflebacteria bacterium]|nr:DUF1844 domain-containing protein [Candidatus Riflebacteria bacterium]
MVDKDEFKISDKRASHEDDGEKPTTPAPAPSPSPDRPAPVPTPPGPTEPPDQTTGDPGGEPSPGPDDEQPLSILELNFFETTNFFLGILIQKAWIALGLVGNPATGQLARDPQEARRLIDLITVIADHLKGKWEHPMLESELQTQLTNLRLQFAKLPKNP